MSLSAQIQLDQKPEKTAKNSKIAILMATYNGQVFLEDQLESIVAQTYPHWCVYASDDGSTDNTRSILARYQEKLGEEHITYFEGQRKGFCQNFLSMVYKDFIQADYYAFCDQDDVWEKDRLARILDWFGTIPADKPAVYCARTELVDHDLQHLGYSPLYPKKPQFSNAIVQSIAGGNTMMFNDAARKIIVAAREHADVSSHDWWIYMLITACGGIVHYDQKPSLRYRQHGANIIGMNRTFAARLTRVRKLNEGRFKKWNGENIAALLPMRDYFPPENQRIFEAFIKARQSWLLPRLFYFKKAGIHRQTLVDNVALFLAAVMGKV